MSLIGGEFDSSGVWDGTYWDWKHAWIPLTVTVVDEDLKTEAECPSLHRQPLFEVEVYDTSTETLTTFVSTSEDGCISTSYVTGVDVSRNVEGQSDSFSLQFQDARAVSPRLLNDVFGLLSTDIRKRVRIKAGFRINGVDHLVRIFTGLALRRGENWKSRGSMMTVSGLSLTYLLTLSPPSIENYSGYLSGLVMEMMEDAGFTSYVLGFDDRFIALEEAFTLIADSVQEALEDLFEVESTLEWYVDAYGTLLLRDTTEESDPVFAYQTGPHKAEDPSVDTCGNIFEIAPSHSVDRVITEVNVVGGNLDATLVYVDAVNQERLGRRTSSLNSALLKTEDAAIAAAQDEISKTQRSMKQMSLGVAANPLLDPFMKLTVKDDYFGSGYDGSLKVLQISHNITKDRYASKVGGEFDEEV